MTALRNTLQNMSLDDMRIVLGQLTNLASSLNDELPKYFSPCLDYFNAPSFHRIDQGSKPISVEGLAEIINADHRHMRALAAKMGNLLDLDTYPNEVRESLAQIKQAITDYATDAQQFIFNSNGGILRAPPGYRIGSKKPVLIDHPRAEKLNELIADLRHNLAQEPVHIKTPDGKKYAFDPGELGVNAIELVALDLASSYVQDQGKLPPEVRGLIFKYAGAADEALNQLNDKRMKLVQKLGLEAMRDINTPRERLVEYVEKNSNYLVGAHWMAKTNAARDWLAFIGKTPHDVRPARSYREALFLLTGCATARPGEWLDWMTHPEPVRKFVEAAINADLKPSDEACALAQSEFEKLRQHPPSNPRVPFQKACDEFERQLALLKQKTHDKAENSPPVSRENPPGKCPFHHGI